MKPAETTPLEETENQKVGRWDRPVTTSGLNRFRRLPSNRSTDRNVHILL